MIFVAQIIALILVLGAFFDAARRRTGSSQDGLLFVAFALGGFVVFPLGATVIGMAVGLDLGLLAWVPGWAWVFLMYGSIFVILGRGRRAKGTWHCPDCQLIHPATTLVCGCGESAPTA